MIRQLLTESMILSLVSGVVGVLTAIAALQFVQFVPPEFPGWPRCRWTGRCCLSRCSFPWSPRWGSGWSALQSSKAEIAVAMREGGRGSGTSAKTNRLRGLLIASESALAVVLMVGAGLLLRTFWGLLQENPGFNPSSMVAAISTFHTPPGWIATPSPKSSTLSCERLCAA